MVASTSEGAFNLIRAQVRVYWRMFGNNSAALAPFCVAGTILDTADTNLVRAHQFVHMTTAIRRVNNVP
jgi:hypothetical protein